MHSHRITNAEKVILVSNKKYTPEYDGLLNSLIKSNITLFCAIGKDCEKWEEAVDWLCVGENGENLAFVTTTNHPNETLEEVKEFANNWPGKGNNEIQIIKI